MNKISIVTLIGLIIFFAILINTGCKKDDTPAVTEFTIKIDSIQHADTILATNNLEVGFYGLVGTSDCYEFLKINNEFDVNKIEVELIGQHTARDDCNPGNQYMNPVTITYSDLTVGTWTIHVIQPEGQQPMESTVVVE